jgi:hypothetical protein
VAGLMVSNVAEPETAWPLMRCWIVMRMRGGVA